MRPIFFLFLMLLSLHSPARAEEVEQKLPLPRFVSLRSDETNIRTGPGERYPILWVYKRKHMPVEIIEEFEHWRKIRDVEGTEGWVLKSLLEGKRYAVIRGGVQTLRRAPENDAPPLLRVKPLVVGRLLECTAEWCRLQVESHKGWIQKTHIWGVYKKEEWEE